LALDEKTTGAQGWEGGGDNANGRRGGTEKRPSTIIKNIPGEKCTRSKETGFGGRERKIREKKILEGKEEKLCCTEGRN